MLTNKPLSQDQLHTLPKVLLHDHLDGGLRPETMLELAQQIGHELPADTPTDLAHWFVTAANSGSLEQYLETFAHTVALMQRPEAITRIAAECVLDLAADGVVYAESRFAPELCVQQGLTMAEVVEAALAGFRQGEQAAAAAGHRIQVGLLLDGMRMFARCTEVAELALAYRDQGVVGFDIAGAETGFPAMDQREAFELLREAGMNYTIHAGESEGPDSVAQAVIALGGQRIGHGVRIIEDVSWPTGVPVGEATFGRTAAFVRDRQIPLEVCPSSNLQTGIASTIAEHPVDQLYRLGFNITINTDNRLVSGTSMTREFELLQDTFGYGLADFYRFTRAALEAAFIPYPQRQDILRELINPGYGYSEQVAPPVA